MVSFVYGNWNKSYTDLKLKRCFAKNGKGEECKIFFLRDVNIVLVMYVDNQYVIIHHFLMWM